MQRHGLGEAGCSPADEVGPGAPDADAYQEIQTRTQSWNRSTTFVLYDCSIAHHSSCLVPSTRRARPAKALREPQERGGQYGCLETGHRVQLGISVLDFLSDFGIFDHRSIAGLSRLIVSAVNRDEDHPERLVCPHALGNDSQPGQAG
jgi:hypothetical protein